MRYKIVTLIVFCLLFSNSKTQTFGFTQSAKPYTELTNTTPIDINKYTDTIPIGFDVSIQGQKSNMLVVSHFWGYFYFPNQLATQFTFFGTELTGGNFSYLVEGVAGSRIFKLQAKNVGFGHDFTQQDYINVQVWIYEADNTFEVRYGKSYIQNWDLDFYFGMGGPQVGFTNFKLTGGAGLPITTTADTARISGMPANGKAYIFNVLNLSIDEQLSENRASIFPNPVKDHFIIDAEVEKVILYDMMGKQLNISFEKMSQYTLVDISHIKVGTYIVKIFREKGVETQKLVVE